MSTLWRREADCSIVLHRFVSGHHCTSFLCLSLLSLLLKLQTRTALLLRGLYPQTHDVEAYGFCWNCTERRCIITSSPKKVWKARTSFSCFFPPNNRHSLCLLSVFLCHPLYQLCIYIHIKAADNELFLSLRHCSRSTLTFNQCSHQIAWPDELILSVPIHLSLSPCGK